MVAFLRTPLSCRESVLGGEGMTRVPVSAGDPAQEGEVTVPLGLLTFTTELSGATGVCAALSSPEHGPECGRPEAGEQPSSRPATRPGFAHDGPDAHCSAGTF